MLNLIPSPVPTANALAARQMISPSGNAEEASTTGLNSGSEIEIFNAVIGSQMKTMLLRSPAAMNMSISSMPSAEMRLARSPRLY